MQMFATVAAIYVTRRGRFAVLIVENLPKGDGHQMRFHVPSESLQCSDRVKIDIELHVKKPKAETLVPEPAKGVSA